MSLTSGQSAWLAAFDTNVAAFRAALEASMEADNAPSGLTLDDAQGLSSDLRNKFAELAINLGYYAPGGNPWSFTPPAHHLPLAPLTEKVSGSPSVVTRVYNPPVSGYIKAYQLPAIETT
jgi:hypothetical protein